MPSIGTVPVRIPRADRLPRRSFDIGGCRILCAVCKGCGFCASPPLVGAGLRPARLPTRHPPTFPVALRQMLAGVGAEPAPKNSGAPTKRITMNAGASAPEARRSFTSPSALGNLGRGTLLRAPSSRLCLYGCPILCAVCKGWGFARVGLSRGPIPNAPQRNPRVSPPKDNSGFPAKFPAALSIMAPPQQPDQVELFLRTSYKYAKSA